MNDAELKRKVCNAMYEQCKARGYAAPVDVLMDIGVLDKKKYEDWRFGRVYCLERVCQTNLSKLSTALHEMRSYAAKTGLKPSFTFYKQWGAKRTIPLRFSKSGNENIEKAYATHFVGMPGKAKEVEAARKEAAAKKAGSRAESVPAKAETKQVTPQKQPGGAAAPTATASEEKPRPAAATKPQAGAGSPPTKKPSGVAKTQPGKKPGGGGKQAGRNPDAKRPGPGKRARTAGKRKREEEPELQTLELWGIDDWWASNFGGPAPWGDDELPF